MIKLLITNRGTKQQKSYRLLQNNIVFGRAANCDVILDSNGVSRKHMQLVVHKNLVEIEDFGSGNGTIINQKKIPVKERVPLQPDDVIRVEEFEIHFELDATPAPALGREKFDTTDPDILEIKMIKKILGAFDNERRPGFVVISSPFNRLKAHIDHENKPFTIGRDNTCELSLETPVVSRKHAKVTKKWGGFVVTDLESKNGTFVNGERVTEKALSDGDEVVFGTIKTIFKNPQEFNIDDISRSMQPEVTKPTPEPEPVVVETPEVKEVKKEEVEKETVAPKADPAPESVPEPAAAAAPVQTPTAQKSLFKSLSFADIALLGFGILVFILIITMLVMVMG